MLKRDGKWEEVDWSTALEFVASELGRIRTAHGDEAIGALAAPHSTLEELYMLGKLSRGIGGGNVDFRLRNLDFPGAGSMRGAPWLGMKVADIPALDRILVVGSTLRKEQPLLAQRMRQAVKKNAQFNLVNPVDDDLFMRVAGKAIVAPGAMADALAQIVKAAAEIKGVGVPAAVAATNIEGAARKIAESLASGNNRGIFLGNLAQHHPRAGELHRLAQELARIVGAKLGFFGEAGNSVGGYLAGALPSVSGLDAAQMLARPRKAYLLMNAEMDFDTADARTARMAMQSAELVVALSPFKHAQEYAQVLLPVSPFTETAGTFVNAEGRVQSFQGVTRPLGETRPAWKVLRVLGTLLQTEGFEYGSIEEVRAECLAGIGDVTARLDNATAAPLAQPSNAPAGVQRIGEVPIYHVDGIVRRAHSLQLTRDALAAGVVSLPGALVEKLGLRQGDRVRVVQQGAEATLPYLRDDRLPAGCARIAAGHPDTAALGPLMGAVELERVAVQERASA